MTDHTDSATAKRRPGRRQLETTPAIQEMIQEYWVSDGPDAVLQMARDLRPSLTMANLRNYYHALARQGKVKGQIRYRRARGWSEDELGRLRTMAEAGMSAGAIAAELGVRRWAVLAACSAHGISVKRAISHAD